MCRILRKAFLFLFLLLSLSLATAYADHPTAGIGSVGTGPIITISASTLEKGQWAFVTRFEYADFESFSDEELIEFAEAEEDVHSLDSLSSPFFGLAYGVTDDFSVSLRAPYVRRTNIREGAHEENGHGDEDEGDGHDDERIANEGPEVHVHGDSSGIGDMILFGQYRFAKSTDRKLEAAALFGLKMPVGKDDATDDNGELFETEHQPGSGSWDPLFGVAVTRRFERISLDANILYTLSTEGSQNTNLGDLLHYNFAFSYRLNGEAPHSDAGAHAHHHYYWDATAELNGEWQDKHKIGDETEDNSGCNIIHISPGIRLSRSESWTAFFSVGIPIAQDLNGFQHETSVRMLTGFGIAF